jgi:hypothetical protein
LADSALAAFGLQQAKADVRQARVIGKVRPNGPYSDVARFGRSAIAEKRILAAGPRRFAPLAAVFETCLLAGHVLHTMIKLSVPRSSNKTAAAMVVPG